MPHRRRRIHALLVMIFALLLAACAGAGLPRQEPTPAQATAIPALPSPTESRPAAPEASSTPEPIPQTGATNTPTAQGAAGEGGTCPASPAQPNYSRATTMGPINGQPASTARGERLMLAGTIYDKNCQPVPGFSFNVWHTDPAGLYGPPSSNSSEVNCCYYGGTVRTDAQGRYVILTVKPAPYLGQPMPPPAHLHIESVSASPAGNLAAEIVFAGDPRLTTPERYTNPPPVHLQQETDAQGAYWLGVADMRLAGALPTASAPAGATASPTAQAGTGGAGPVTFVIIPGESVASYQIREKFAKFAEMTSPVGVTKDVEGKLVLQLGDAPRLDSLTVRVGLSGLNTGEPMRDEKLYDRWLVTRSFPDATFSATGVKNAPSQYTEGQETSFLLPGSLTIRDVTRPVEFHVKAVLEKGVITGQAETKILMTDFGIQPPDLLGFVKVENEVMVRVTLKAAAQ